MVDKTTAVLVDVDGTLINHDNTFNEALVQALRDAGVDKLYLFTSMSLRDIVAEMIEPDYLSRPDLIKWLKKQGITVLGVLTPADVTYQKGPGSAYKDYFVPQHSQFIKGKFNQDNYQDDREFCKARDNFAAYLDETGKIVRAEADQIKARLKVEHALLDDAKIDEMVWQLKPTDKSKLYEYFLEQNPQMKRVVVIDDADKQLLAVESAASRFKNVTTTTLNVEDEMIGEKLQTALALKRVSSTGSLLGKLSRAQSPAAASESSSSSPSPTPSTQGSPASASGASSPRRDSFLFSRKSRPLSPIKDEPVSLRRSASLSELDLS